jgi:ABC-2 type transport system permease protein
MKKYLTVFAIDWQNQFTYRLNFILWRLRNILRLLMVYFLWNGIFTTNKVIAGYSRPEMLTYVFLVLAAVAIVLSAPSADNVGGEIASGDLSNFLVKPVSYIRYWFIRDLSSKLLNLSFSVVEATILWLLLRPEIVFPTQPLIWLAVIFSLGLAIPIYYFLGICARFVSFWAPEDTWGLGFLVLIFVEIFSGMIFPLDILPEILQRLIQLTPFPYLIYYPIAIFLGKFQGWELIRILAQTAIWSLLMYKFCEFTWKKGLKIYGAVGR